MFQEARTVTHCLFVAQRRFCMRWREPKRQAVKEATAAKKAVAKKVVGRKPAAKAARAKRADGSGETPATGGAAPGKARASSPKARKDKVEDGS